MSILVSFAYPVLLSVLPTLRPVTASDPLQPSGAVPTPPAATSSLADQGNPPSFSLFGGSLTVAPKVFNDGTDSSIGLDYKFQKEFRDFVKGTEVDAYIESFGLIARDKDTTPEARLTHRLRLSVIDILGDQSRDFALKHDMTVSKQVADIQDLAVRAKDDDAAKAKVAREELEAKYQALMGKPLGPPDADGDYPELDSLLEKYIAPTSNFVTAELALGAESDQDFSTTQLVGGLGVRAKSRFLAAPLDFLFQAVRGYEKPLDYVNFEGGAYIWGGLDLVDASENEDRKALTSDTSFSRWYLGAFYRNELFAYESGGNSHPVAVELEYRYYDEIDAPDSIRQADQDHTSWFRGTVVLPNNAIVEYTDGQQPLDQNGSSTLSVGWRFSF